MSENPQLFYLVIKIYLRWFSEKMMKIFIIIIIITTSTIICLLRSVYVPALSLLDFFTIFTCAYSVYTVF